MTAAYTCVEFAAVDFCKLHQAGCREPHATVPRRATRSLAQYCAASVPPHRLLCAFPHSIPLKYHADGSEFGPFELASLRQAWTRPLRALFTALFRDHGAPGASRVRWQVRMLWDHVPRAAAGFLARPYAHAQRLHTRGSRQAAHFLLLRLCRLLHEHRLVGIHVRVLAGAGSSHERCRRHSLR